VSGVDPSKRQNVDGSAVSADFDPSGLQAFDGLKMLRSSTTMGLLTL
jgi:hypothetical protein